MLEGTKYKLKMSAGRTISSARHELCASKLRVWRRVLWRNKTKGGGLPSEPEGESCYMCARLLLLEATGVHGRTIQNEKASGTCAAADSD